MKKRKIFWRIFTSFLAVGGLGLLSYFAIVVIYIYQWPVAADSDKRQIYGFFVRNLGLTSLAMIVIMALVSFYLAKRIARPIEMLEHKTQEALSSVPGEALVYRDYQTEEVSRLAQLIGDLHAHLNNRVNKVTTQKNEQEAIFMALSEGVMAISGDGKIKRMNTAAKKLFQLEDRFQKGLHFAQITEQEELKAFVADSLAKKQKQESQIELFQPAYRALKVTAAPYMNMARESLGLVLVFSDVTKLKNLERHRSEFVANVSHELRTPLTSIQGFAETMLHPKMLEQPQRFTEFAEKIRDNSIRLKAMIEDLLLLAQIEQSKKQGAYNFQELSLAFLLRRALEICKPKAQSLGIGLYLDIQEDLKYPVNEGLMIQVFVNLIDNAIKYSGTSKRVEISLERGDKSQRVQVRDYGEGIALEHQERLFERFYRIDRDRSRKTGGSGLGLSIVKNILHLHGLDVGLRSELGQGSCFFIDFPQPGLRLEQV